MADVIDISDKYVQMMVKCEELQELWKPMVYDWTYNSQTKNVNAITSYEAEKLDLKGTGVAWLPDMNQLYNVAHGIIGVGWVEFDVMLLNYYRQINEQIERTTFGKRGLEITKEKLSILFLMERCYNKYWDAEKQAWVLIPKIHVASN